MPVTFGHSGGGLAGDGMGPLFVSLDAPANPTADPGYPEGRLLIDRLGTANVAPLLTEGRINPALAANRVQVIRDTHGKTSHLTPADIEALSLYLLSLE